MRYLAVVILDNFCPQWQPCSFRLELARLSAESQCAFGMNMCVMPIAAKPVFSTIDVGWPMECRALPTVLPAVLMLIGVGLCLVVFGFVDKYVGWMASPSHSSP